MNENQASEFETGIGIGAVDVIPPSFHTLDVRPFTDEQWWSMCDANMSLPESLAKADLTRPFVYDRRYGVFHVPSGHHQHAMSILLAFRHGHTKGLAVAEHLGLEFSHGTADEWLRTTPGACFLSSVGRNVLAGSRDSLSVLERRIIGRGVSYAFE